MREVLVAKQFSPEGTSDIDWMVWSLRFQDVKLWPCGIQRVGQSDRIIISLTCCDGIGPDRGPLTPGQSTVRAAQ